MELAKVSAVAHSILHASPKSMGDNQLLDSYRAINSIERASWVSRCAISAEIYARIRASVGARLSRKEIAKQDAELQRQLQEVCKAVGVGYQVFMYDCRIYHMFFDADLDAVAEVPSREMVDATEIFSRSIFAEATASKDPRGVIKHMVAEFADGKSVTSEIVRAHIKTIEKSGEKPPEGRIIATIREGALPPEVEGYIIDILNACASVLEGSGPVDIKGARVELTREGVKVNERS